MVKNRHILAHFKDHDPILFSVITSDSVEGIVPRPSSEYFVSLCRTIIGQQLSTTVADVIFSRFEALFHPGKIVPETVLAFPDDTFRRIGMSGAKVRFVKDVAEKVKRRKVDLSTLQNMTDADVMTTLTKIKGVGPWTAEMFCMFTLGREDLFSFGDLGLKRAIQKLYKLKKEPSERTMQRLSNSWKPYRTYAALALWAYLDQS